MKLCSRASANIVPVLVAIRGRIVTFGNEMGLRDPRRRQDDQGIDDQGVDDLGMRLAWIACRIDAAMNGGGVS